MARVVHFEITADDPERAGRFYQQALGWTVQKYGGPLDYWLAGTGPDKSAELMARSSAARSPARTP